MKKGVLCSYAFLLAVLAFLLEFIPIIGIYITIVAVVALALTQGWLTGVLALAIVLLLQLLENNVFALRIVGRAVGINPIVNIFALVAGTNLFGIAGAFFAAPIAGVIQALIRAFWSNWRDQHPEQFPDENDGAKLQRDDVGNTASVQNGQTTLNLAPTPANNNS